MMKNSFDFNFIEKNIRKKTFGIIGTVTKKGRSHSTGVLYSVAKKEDPFRLYCVSDNNYKKARNIKNNSNVSFVIPFPHFYIRFVPSSCIQFMGVARLLPFRDNDKIRSTFQEKRILKLIEKVPLEKLDDRIFIEIIPDRSIYCHGLGFGLLEMRKKHTRTHFTVEIPQNRYN
ncbi:MAG: pyridoxamine 5'-phosphate oxidase family protein [Candidatus Hodarchaeales archaeon]|jgi:hypothetical protein